ncbi:hypothetical protein WCX49_08395 [Sulfurimonas sp. HSL-1656]|uniref:hypothetical protein n=1 Tax=Thiomicrolovo subterrani TaxID=3131934 RepID=UPI0031F99297
MKWFILGVLFELVMAASLSANPLDYNASDTSDFQKALKTQGYPKALFEELKATGNLVCTDVYESNVSLKSSCLNKVSFLRLFVPVDDLNRLGEERPLIEAYFDKACGTACFDWKSTDDKTGQLQSKSPAKITSYAAYAARQDGNIKRLEAAKQTPADYHQFCDMDEALAVVSRLRTKQKTSMFNRILSDDEQWQLYKNESCLRRIATEIFTAYSERTSNLDKDVFSKEETVKQREKLEQEKVELRRLSDANISIRLPKDERFFQDIYDYNNWFVKIYAGYEFLGTDNLLKDGTGRFGLSVYRQMELDPSETHSGIWQGFSITRLHVFFDLAVSGLVVNDEKQENTGDVNVTEVARTGVGRIGAYWPFFRNDEAIDGARFYYDIGIVGTYGLMSIEDSGESYFSSEADGSRLTPMWSWGVRISSSPEMYAEYKWGEIGDYKVSVLRGQFPTYTFSKNASLVLGAEMYDFNADANSRGIDDQVKFYALWRYDLSWMENNFQ